MDVTGNETNNVDEMPLYPDGKRNQNHHPSGITANEDLAKFRGQKLEMYKLYYDPLFWDTVVVGDRSKLPLDCRLVDEDEEHQEGKGDSDDMNAYDDEMDSNESDSYDEDEEN
ncbi:hypothetical protein Tco_0816799 [Tanacetum coccineum]